MSTEAKWQWQTEKARIFELPLEEKRKLYKSSAYFTLNQVNTWYKLMVTYNFAVKDKKPSNEDLAKLRKIKIDPEKNRCLAVKVSVFKGDITKLEVDAIVNATNVFLKGGGHGVDCAIHRAAGPLLQEECYSLGVCPTGDIRVTGGYNLPAKYVIHTVGPQNGFELHLQSCYMKSLDYIEELKLKSIAFPCIATGLYRFPNRLAAHIALGTARKFLEHNTDIERVIFCTFTPIDFEIYVTLMQLYFPIY